MITIKDMTMPTYCQECRFESIDGDWNEAYYYCTAVPNREIIDDMERQRDRMVWCPLSEIVQCKDCKWADDLGISGLYCLHPDHRNPIYCCPNDFCDCGKKW